MTSATDTAPPVAAALKYPVRIEILAALSDCRMSASSLAKAVSADRRTVIRHVRALERLGLVRSFEASGHVMYEPATLAHFSDAAWASLPSHVREVAVATGLARMHAGARAALGSGGFDRDDTHLTRTTLKLCEEGWKELSAHYMELLWLIDQLKGEAADSDEATFDVTAILMLFESKPTDSEPPCTHPESPLPTANELHYESVGLEREIEAVLMDPRTDWAALVKLADELRVVGHAGLAAEERERQAAVSVEP